MPQEKPINPALTRETEGDLVASPPDDGGHLGNFTKPGDVMEVRHAEERTEPTPPTHRDETRTADLRRELPRGGLGVATGTMFIIALVAIALVVVLVLAGA